MKNSSLRRLLLVCWPFARSTFASPQKQKNGQTANRRNWKCNEERLTSLNSLSHAMSSGEPVLAVWHERYVERLAGEPERDVRWLDIFAAHSDGYVSVLDTRALPIVSAVSIERVSSQSAVVRWTAGERRLCGRHRGGGGGGAHAHCGERLERCATLCAHRFVERHRVHGARAPRARPGARRCGERNVSHSDARARARTVRHGAAHKRRRRQSVRRADAAERDRVRRGAGGRRLARAATAT